MSVVVVVGKGMEVGIEVVVTEVGTEVVVGKVVVAKLLSLGNRSVIMLSVIMLLIVAK